MAVYKDTVREVENAGRCTFPSLFTAMKPVTSDPSSASDDEEKKVGYEVTESPGTDDISGVEGVPPCPELTLEQQRRAYRKVDFRLLPILTIMYLASFLDRGA